MTLHTKRHRDKAFVHVTTRLCCPAASVRDRRARPGPCRRVGQGLVWSRAASGPQASVEAPESVLPYTLMPDTPASVFQSA